MTGSIKDYTPNFEFIIPEFNISGWHDYLEENFRSIDALFYNLFGINNFKGQWKNSTVYNVDDVVFIGEDTDYSGRLVKVLIQHTTAGTGNFTEFFTANPSYYELFADASTAQIFAQEAKDWAVKLDGPVENDLYSSKYYANIVNALSTEITTLYNIKNDIQNVSTISSEVVEVSNIKTSVQNVANNRININTVANNISDINTAADDIIAIRFASTFATNAAKYANLAEDWATKMDGLVDNTDYSAKYYADQARQAATSTILDGVTINRNTDDELQTIGIIDNNNGNALKIWTGTLADYNSIVTKDSDTFYYLTDDNKIYKGTILIADNTVVDQTYNNISTNAQSGVAVGSAISNIATQLVNAINTKQDTLVSGTNIKTINNNSILGSGNINIQSGTTYTAGTGIDITNSEISVTNPTIINTSTINSSITIGNDAIPTTAYNSLNIGGTSRATDQGCISLMGIASGFGSISIGYGARTYGNCSISIGSGAEIDNSITVPTHQIGRGTNTEAGTLYVGFKDSSDQGNNYKLLDGSTGLIPYGRIPYDNSTITVNSSGQLQAVGGGGGSSYTAGTGIDIINDVISVTSPTLTNTATGSNAYSVGGTATSTLSCSFGYNATASGSRSTVIGEQANAAGQYATAIGGAASAEGDYAIQLGYGRNSSSNTLSVGFRTNNTITAKNWQLLDGTTGYIPNARINMDSTPTSASTNTVTSGGVYTALSGKADTSSLATVATTGAYSDLSGKPTVDQTYDGTSANAQSGVAVASAISGKANTDLSNISGTSTKSIDGQWVYNYLLLANNVAADNTSQVTQYSLANYLPNDGYNYEVLVQGICNTGTTSGQFMSIVVQTDIYTGSIEICSVRTRSAALLDTRGNGIVAVGTGRYISHIPSNSNNYNGNYTLAVTAYRRIGTNS